MMSRRKIGAAALIIPIDLHEEILSWLQSDALLNFKRVCKQWRLLISSPRFIQKHLERSNSSCNGARIITTDKTDLEIIDMEKNLAKKIPLANVQSFIGSCDGLVLCRLLGGKIAAINPLTGTYVVRTPNPSMRMDIINIQDRRFVCSWFGHHPSTGEYVLVIAHLSRTPSLKGTIMFKVYSLSSNTNNSHLSSSTYHITDGGCCGFAQVGTFLQGRLHCPVSLFSFIFVDEVIILVYSFQRNGNIERMRCPAKSCPTLGIVDGCLSIICVGAKAYELWVMKEYGVEESWTKFANIEGYTINYDEYILSMRIPIVFCPNGYVILNCDGSQITKYSFGNSEAKILKARSYNRCGGIVCIDSLVSPHSLVFGEKEAIVE